MASSNWKGVAVDGGKSGENGFAPNTRHSIIIDSHFIPPLEFQSNGNANVNHDCLIVHACSRASEPTKEGSVADGKRNRLIFNTKSQKIKSRRLQKVQAYGATFVCLVLLERWLELGIPPSDTGAFQKTLQWLNLEQWQQQQQHQTPGKHFKCLIGEDGATPLSLLKDMVLQTRRALWNAALEPPADDHLTVQPSLIPGADKGLFAGIDLPADTVCCYYSGDIHSIQSSQSLPDASYLLRIGKMVSTPWWYSALPCCNDDDDDSEANNKLSMELGCWLQGEWDRIIGDQPATAAAEIFVNPTNFHIKARYINDCLNEAMYNVKYVLDPYHERAAIVTLRPIQAGEELYASYGQAYWESLEASTGIVPQRLPVP